MGYSLYITRKEHWADDNSPHLDISLNEWLEYVNNDKELTLNPTAYRYTKKDSNEEVYALGFADWTGNKDVEGAWFDYSDGIIDSKNPEPETINKMKQIAIALNAKLMGDDGETYDLYSDKVFRDWEQDWKEDWKPEVTQIKKPWWKFWSSK
ncbi:MAG TPA: hypothetical protein PK431_16430 [Chitinophagales bacterium]|nr:hypothetical protein [Chitinophagales bacterium]